MTETDSLVPKYAGFWRRLCAILIDSILFLPLYLFFIGISLNQWESILLCPFYFSWYFIYDIVFLGLFGQTIGMMLMRFKVVRLNLDAIEWRQAFLRYSVDVFIGIVNTLVLSFLFVKAPPDSFDASFGRIEVYFNHLDSSSSNFLSFWVNVSLIWTLSELIILLLNEKKRAIHDFIAGTVVVCVDKNKRILFKEKVELSDLPKIFAVLLIPVLLFFLLLNLSLPLQKNYPNEINPWHPGVQRGKGFLSSDVLVQGAWLYRVQDIIPDPNNSSVFLAVTSNLISSIENDGKVLKTFKLAQAVHGGEWIVSSGLARFMTFVGWTSHLSLIDLDGKVVWADTYHQPAVCAAAGTIMGNSQTQFVVGYKDGNLQLLDAEGCLIWEKMGERLNNVEVVDIKGTGQDEIIGANPENQFVIWDSAGNSVTEYQSPVSIKAFSIIPWAGEGGPWVALLPDKTKYMFYSLETGAPVTEWDSGVNLYRSWPRAVWVNWNSNKEKSLAVLSPLRSTSSILTVFDGAGNIQYLEVFNNYCRALAVVNGATVGSQELLCGCDGKIIKYQKAP